MDQPWKHYAALTVTNPSRCDFFPHTDPTHLLLSIPLSYFLNPGLHHFPLVCGKSLFDISQEPSHLEAHAFIICSKWSQSRSEQAQSNSLTPSLTLPWCPAAYHRLKNQSRPHHNPTPWPWQPHLWLHTISQPKLHFLAKCTPPCFFPCNIQGLLSVCEHLFNVKYSV